jgi:phosphate transport system ATP-binding protein
MSNSYGVDLHGARPALEVRELSVAFGRRKIVNRVSLVVPDGRIVALVGPSGCGKTTLLKCLNRMNDLNPEARVSGQVFLFGKDIYAKDVDPSAVRRQVGMVFQKPTPFPKSVFENLAFGPQVAGEHGDLNQIVENALKGADLWEELNDRLAEPAMELSPGQQQRLCIARALSVEPRVLLMDEPVSGADPLSSQKIEDLLRKLRDDYTIVLVTQDLHRAARISDFTALFEAGELVEYGPTESVFTNPREKRTEDYLTGRFQ